MAFNQTQRETLLAAAASGVKRTSVDGLTVESQSASDLIALLNYAASSDADRTKRPYRLQRFKSPGFGNVR